MLAITASFWLRRILGHTGWRMLHYVSFSVWLVALAHGIGVGNDTIKPWAAPLYLATAEAVAYLTVYRVLSAGRRLDPPIPPRRPFNARVIR